jgi:hypothetical protein
MITDKMARPLDFMTDEIFQRLRDTYFDLCSRNPGKMIECPFIPVIGAKYFERNCPRVMFIGKATGRWDGVPEPNLIEQIAANGLWCDINLARQSSAFWRFARERTVDVWKACSLETEKEPQWAVDRLVWSNLAKIAVDRTQPTGPDADIQRKLNAEILEREVSKLSPSIIFITTGDYEGEETGLVHTVFGPNKDWDKHLPNIPPQEARSWYQLNRKFSALVFWTPHPQASNWANRHSEIASMIGLVREGLIKAIPSRKI